MLMVIKRWQWRQSIASIKCPSSEIAQRWLLRFVVLVDESSVKVVEVWGEAVVQESGSHHDGEEWHPVLDGRYEENDEVQQVLHIPWQSNLALKKSKKKKIVKRYQKQVKLNLCRFRIQQKREHWNYEKIKKTDQSKRKKKFQYIQFNLNWLPCRAITNNYYSTVWLLHIPTKTLV